MKSALLFWVLALFGSSLCQPDYYWRDYNGKVPDDAVPGGEDSKGDTTYIGQVFLLNHGAMIGQIYPGQKSICVSRLGVHHISLYNKILCSGHKNNFRWIPGDASSLHVTTINKTLVVGGFEDARLLSIGRVRYGGEVRVSKVCSSAIGDAKMWFPYNGEEIKANSYEVLIYEDPEPSINNIDSVSIQR